ncbi:unnamed protein product [Pipistrellus nathusii]|uniref:FHA domain-containing protein n=1 Tax=Pipistrellus nathusii TaxID=59473 RepID=A0ABP0A6D2_PIPNA
MERPLTVLRMSLYHPTQGSAVFATVPQRLQHDTSPLLVGRGLGSHLQLHLPGLSRQHLSLEPYREQGGALLAFSLKALSRRGCVWVNGLALRFLEQVPLGTVNRVIFAGIQMVVHVEGGTSLEAFVCCFHVSPSPLICRPQAEETDEWEDIPEEPPAPGSEQPVPGHVGFPHGPSQAVDSSPEPRPGGGTEIQLQREAADSGGGAPCSPHGHREHSMAETGLELS